MSGNVFQLEVLTSRRRAKRIEEAIKDALLKAGTPYRRWAVIARDNGEEGVRVEVVPRETLLRRLEVQALDVSGDDGQERAATLRQWAKVARGYFAQRFIPEYRSFADGGAELYSIEPPEGTW